MATKKKKGMNVELNDFDFDEQDIARMQQERAGAAERVAKFNKDFEPTGSAFNDTGLLSGTSRDIKTMRTIDTFLDKAADRAATVRAQDAGLEVERGKIGVDTARNTIFDKQIDNQMELGLKDIDLGKGELDLNKDIFKQTSDRYKKYGEPADIMNLTEKAAGIREGLGDIGLEMGDETMSSVNRFIKGDSVAKPSQTTMIDEAQTMYNQVPEQFPNSVTGLPTLSYESKGVSPIFQAANLGVMLGKKINRAATPARSSLRRRIKKVQ